MAAKPVNRAVANELWVQLCTATSTCWLPVLTDSMMPLLQPGDQVQVSKIVAEEVRFGDIVVFRRGDELIVHRVLKKWHTANGVHFSEKGDAGYAYGLISAGNVVGRVIRVKKGTKTLDLNSLPSRMASLIVSTWLCLTAACVSHLKSSESRTITRVGKVLYRAAHITSRFLVIVCFVIWYLAGLLTRGKSVPKRPKSP